MPPKGSSAKAKGKRKAAESEEEAAAASESEAADASEEEEEEEQPRQKKRKGAAPTRRSAKQEDGGAGAGSGARRAKPRTSGAAFRAEPPAEAGADDVDAAALAEQYAAEADKLGEHAQCQAISAQETERLVADVMRVMLFRRHRDGAPVSRADLTAVVTKTYKDKRSLPPYILALAQRRFLSVFGLEMKALDKAKRSEADVKKKVASAVGTAAAAERTFVLRSALPAHLRAAYVDAARDDAARGLTLAVLSLVAIAGEKGLPEDTLWTQLAQLGVLKGAKDHPALGDVDAAVEALVKQRYLQRSKAAGPDGERKVFELAENARDEVGDKKLAAFIARTMRTRLPAADGAGGVDDA